MMHPSHKVTLRDIDIELTNRNEDDNDNDSNEESVMVHTESSDQSANDEEGKDEQEETRGVWANKREFFFAIVGYTVGIGSVWRFPIVCSRNGGGAFLIPFFFFLITCGGPLYYLEVCIGQFSGKSAGLAFEFCPLLKGLGLLQVMLSLTVLWYVMLIFDWALYFLYSSFNSVLPWTHCDNDWNTDKCVGIIETPASNSTFDHSHPTNLIHRNYSIATLVNSTSDEGDTYSHTMASYMNDSEQSSSAFEFWEHHVLRKSRGLEEMGNIQFHLAICLLLSWMFCAAAVIKGVKVLGKVVYVTALAPYVLMSIFLIQGLTLDGAADGIKTYLSPDFSKLLTTQVWLDAAVQVFYSLGPTWGGVITMSSYNKFHQRTFWSSTLCVANAGFTSFFNGLVVFVLLGFTAHSSGKTVDEVAAQSGPGLMFVVFPSGLSMMPLPQLWTFLFFLMFVTVAFDSLFGMLETVSGFLIDMFPHQLLKRREMVTIVVALSLFFLGLPLTMNGGIYLFQLADWYFSSFALLIGSFLECVAICWIYGTDRFVQDISLMTGRESCVLLRVLWGIIIPIIIVVVFLLTVTQLTAPTDGTGYIYSTVAIAFGIFFGFVPVISLLSMSVLSIVQGKGTLVQRFWASLAPSKKWIPNDHTAEELYLQKPYIYNGSICDKIKLNLLGGEDTPLF